MGRQIDQYDGAGKMVLSGSRIYMKKVLKPQESIGLACTSTNPTAFIETLLHLLLFPTLWILDFHGRTRGACCALYYLILLETEVRVNVSNKIENRKAEIKLFYGNESINGEPFSILYCSITQTDSNIIWWFETPWRKDSSRIFHVLIRPLKVLCRALTCPLNFRVARLSLSLR